MENPNETRRVQELIDEYNRELMSTYRQRPKTPPSSESNWLDEQYPLPDIARDRAALAAAAPAFSRADEDLLRAVPRNEETPAPPEIGPSPYVGYLRVFVFTGQTAEPLQGATVSVSRQEALYASSVTNRDGFTPILPLPSVDPALTMRPNAPTPYVAYDIRVDALGFQPVIYKNVPVYGNNYVTQSANMLPLIPGQDPNTSRVYHSGAPTNL
jgi:hypothetical protein